MPVQPQSVSLARAYPARVHAVADAQVRARVPGLLVAQAYQEGARVEAGTLLFRIDPAPFEARVAQAEAEAQRAQAQLRQAQREWERVAALFAENAVSARQRDEAQSALELAEAVSATAQAALRAARIDLGYTRVTAPIGGVTGLRAVSEGNLVNVGDLLTSVQQIDPIHVLFSVPEADAALYRRHLTMRADDAAPSQGRLRVKARSSDGLKDMHEGMIDFLAARVDAQTGNVQVRAIFPNPQGELTPGQFVRVSIEGLRIDDALVVPPQAIAQGAEGPVVYVVDDQQQAQPRPVTLGALAEQGQVIGTGLSGGERVIVGGLVGVRPGARVAPSDPPVEAAP
ncbi:efflux RND transporter periplasmic adaptor subunit [Sinimarinibacterium flocculans]